jgi:hypothetical protein
MIAAPAPGAPATVGPLPSPDEQELAAAYPELRDHALTISWAAELLGLPAAQLAALAPAGEVLAIPGPWPMRQAHVGGLGYFLPAWQFAARRPHPELPALLRTAAAAGWTSLELDRFMTAPNGPARTTPAQLLQESGAAPVLELLPGGHEPLPAPA